MDTLGLFLLLQSTLSTHSSVHPLHLHLPLGQLTTLGDSRILSHSLVLTLHTTNTTSHCIFVPRPSVYILPTTPLIP